MSRSTDANKKRRLVTSALPYVNNIPHLGNLVQVLSADVFARYCRLCGYDTLYICGSDEYGTATETRAQVEGITPQELCDHYYQIHRDIYEWFNISFDKFGRTATPVQTEVTQHIFWRLYHNGYIEEREIRQLYSEKSEQFLPDRYVLGTCPHCEYEQARGDQCERCGKLLDPIELINPVSAIDQSTPVVKKTRHLYLNLPAILPQLNAWLAEAPQKGKWANNAVKMTRAWIRDGLKARAITRDLKWGIPVPLDGFREKVFYVWFDAPIGYISITASLLDEWEQWWRNPEEVELFQFIGKDNIPFHTVVFPSALLGTGEKWTMLHHLSSSEYLNYEGTQFSKSRGVGVFGNDARDTGISADIWRFYIFYNRPETSDYNFTWSDFQGRVNGDLIGNLGNLINRTLAFTWKANNGKFPEGRQDDQMWDEFMTHERRIVDCFERVEIRAGLHALLRLSSQGNKIFQDAEPWKGIHEDREQVENLLYNLIYLVRDLAILMAPYLPHTSEIIAQYLGNTPLLWENLGKMEGIERLERPHLLFRRIEDAQVAQWQKRFGGMQAQSEKSADEAEPSPEAIFETQVQLVAARILTVEPHPDADRLYLITLDDGANCGDRQKDVYAADSTDTADVADEHEGAPRRIVSGLVRHYTPEELAGRTVILVANLKPHRFRGVMSHGMLLAASPEDDESRVEVLFVDHAPPGTPILLDTEGSGAASAKRQKGAGTDGTQYDIIHSGIVAEATGKYSLDETQYDIIPIDILAAARIEVRGSIVYVGETPIQCLHQAVRTHTIPAGGVH